MTLSGSLRPLASRRGSAPIVNDRGDIVAFRPNQHGYNLAALRHGSSHWHKLRQVLGDATARWLGPDRILVVKPRKVRSSLFTLGLDGRWSAQPTVISARVGALDAGTSYAAPIVLTSMSGPPRAWLWSPNVKPRAIPGSWRSGCVSPDGSHAILIGRDGVGIAPTKRPSKVELLGKPAHKILACAWSTKKYGTD